MITFGGLFGEVATAGGSPPGAELTVPQRRRVVSIAIEERRARLGPLRRSAARPGFALAFERLLDELQAAGLGPEAVEAGAGTLEGSAYLGDLATLFAGYEEVREAAPPGRFARDRPRGDRPAAPLGRTLGGAPGLPLRVRRPDPEPVRRWSRPSPPVAEVTVAVPHEEGSAALRGARRAA